MGVASGMAATGLTVFAHSFGCFAARRMFDQAFLAAGYSELPVHVIGSDPGVCAAFNGATHMPFEDCALYMNIPNAVVIDSCDFAQTKALTRKLAACGSPSYMRLIRKGFTTVYADGSDFEIGKGVTLRDGQGRNHYCLRHSGRRGTQGRGAAGSKGHFRPRDRHAHLEAA